MASMIGNGINKKSRSKRTGTVPLVLAFSAAAFAASGVSYGAKPLPALNAAVCSGISGTWTTLPGPTCTIAAGTSGVASVNFRIVNGVNLDVHGSLTLNKGVNVANSGTIIVENTGGALPTDAFGDDNWPAGILLLGTLDNSGTINIGNAYSEEQPGVFTAGITVWVSAADWNDPSTFVPGTLTNSGTINIQNSGQTRGIQNLGTLANSASGIINVENTAGQVVTTSSVGIYNERQVPSFFYVNGDMTNAGRITISSSGDSSGGTYTYGYGIYNNGHFINSNTGTFTIGPSPLPGDARGFYNSGNFTNYYKFINNHGTYVEGDVGADADHTTGNWGSFNDFPGTMINLGTTSVGSPTSTDGTFYNAFIMINYGEITSYGTFYDSTYGGLLMVNSGTFYNYGYIVGGLQKGICIDEPGAPGGC